jgi:pimeloyl-ACP methyl ester carboxylesterase
MPSFSHDGLSFNYADTGSGTPFVFQHGLGGDVGQPFDLFRPPAGFRLLAFDARAHGQTRPLGDEDKIGLASFADDLLFFLDYLGIDKAVIGGISMGAAVALNFALRYPQRVLGLVLSRPAWLDRARPETVYWCSMIAGLIRQHGAGRGKELFLASPEHAEVLRESPDVAGSLARQFDSPRAEETVVKLERIPSDAPCRSLDELKSIRVPTLVLANRQDPVHPLEYGEILSRAIPGATFREIAAKSVSPEQHAADVQAGIEAFLTKHFGGST